MSSDPFTLWETNVMRRLGLADREDMRSLREEFLSEGVDWAKVGQRIMLSEKAAEKLALELKLFPARLAAIKTAQAASGYNVPSEPEKTRLGAVPPADAPEKTVPAEKTPLVALAVLSQRVVNPHILLCRPLDARPEDRSRWVRVRVKNARNFLPIPAATGWIMARPAPEGDGSLYDFAGRPPGDEDAIPRCPRWPGRW
jgi:hypothetical protein